MGVIRRCPPEHVERIALAAAAGGLMVVEVTMDSERAADQIERVCAAVPEHVVVGAGTVTSMSDVDTALSAGAGFLVAPGFDPAVVQRAVARGVTIVPGVMTPSEAMAAVDALSGAGPPPVCKLFPAGVLGVDFLQAMSAPFADVRWICTGGIGIENARGFLDAGAAVGLGSCLFPDVALTAGDAEIVEALVRQAVAHLTN